MTVEEFRAYATAEGYDEPKPRVQPPNKLFDTHTHKDDLIVLILEGQLSVGYPDRTDTFGPGDMCYVPPDTEHTDTVGSEGASYFLAWRSVDSAAA